MMDCLDSYIPDYNEKRTNDYNCMQFETQKDYRNVRNT